MRTLVAIPYQPPSPSFQNVLQQFNEMWQKVEAAAQTVEWSQVSGPTNYGCLQNLGQGYALAGLSRQVAAANELIRAVDVTAAAEQIGRLICECDQLRREKAQLLDAVRPGVNTEPGDTFGAHLIWWPDELPVPVAVGVQGSRVMKMPEEPPTDNPVQSDIERTIDHLLNGRTTKDQRKGLSTATERAERVPAGDDAAVGRAIR